MSPCYLHYKPILIVWLNCTEEHIEQVYIIFQRCT